MSVGLFLLCVGTLATGVFVFAAFVHMRSQKKAMTGLEQEP